MRVEAGNLSSFMSHDRLEAIRRSTGGEGYG